jgi:hypothetical protein
MKALSAQAVIHKKFDGGKDRGDFRMKKKPWNLVGIIALVAVIGLGLAGCGGGNPKGLAKESYDLGMKALGALFDEAKQAELEKEAEKIAAKVEKLSEADKKVYEEELVRLSGEGLGGLFGLGEEALDAANKIAEIAGDLQTAAGSTGENSGNIPSELLGGWYYKSDKEKNGSAVLEFTSDGKCTSGIQWFAVSVSGNTITYDFYEMGTETGTFDYRITNGELSITGTTADDGLFAVIQQSQQPLVKK